MIVINKQKFSTFITVLCIIDIFMFPYIRALSCSLSMIIVMLWYLFNLGSITVKNAMFVVVPLVIVSVLLGYLVYNYTGGISTAVLVIYSMLFFYYISRCYNDTVKKIISKIIFFYITFVLIMGVIYVVSVRTYFSIRMLWSLHNTEIEFNSYLINRFTFIYSDPNNAGCALAAIFAYSMLCENHKTWKYVYYTFAISFCILLTMSVQAIVAFGVVSIAILFLRGKQYAIVKRIVISVILAELIILLFVANGLFDSFPVFEKIFKRISTNNLSTAGGRLSFWADTINNALSLENLIIGKGAVIDSLGNKYIPHSGILYMTISYGLIVNVAYIITIFVLPRGSKFKYYIVLLPLMTIYTMNTGVSDYRFITMMTLLSAIIHQQAAFESKQDLIDRNALNEGL